MTEPTTEPPSGPRLPLGRAKRASTYEAAKALSITTRMLHKIRYYDAGIKPDKGFEGRLVWDVEALRSALLEQFEVPPSLITKEMLENRFGKTLHDRQKRQHRQGITRRRD